MLVSLSSIHSKCIHSKVETNHLCLAWICLLYAFFFMLVKQCFEALGLGLLYYILGLFFLGFLVAIHLYREALRTCQALTINEHTVNEKLWKLR